MVFVALPEQYAAPTAITGPSRWYVETFGLYQPWRVFSPPRNETLALEAKVTFDDGSRATWRPPRRDPLVGSYSDYRWQKYTEHAALRGNVDEWPRLFEPLARYVANELTTQDRRVVRVVLITRRATNLPVGERPDRAPERVDEYFTLDLSEDEGRR